MHLPGSILKHRIFQPAHLLNMSRNFMRRRTFQMGFQAGTKGHKDLNLLEDALPLWKLDVAAGHPHRLRGRQL